MMTDYAVELAKIALEIKAIKLSPQHPFRWASGFYMPIYNDNRMLLGNPAHRQLVARGFQHLIQESKIPYTLIAGTSTAGISPGTTLADLLQVPFLYIRDKPKDHGLHNQIEGIDSESSLGEQTVIVVEDLISTGGSSLKAVQAVRNARGIVDNLLSIFHYGLPDAEQMFTDAHCAVHSLLTYDVLLNVAKDQGYITGDQIQMLEEWRGDPFVWGEKRGFPRGETMSFRKKWHETVATKDSILCAGLDPAEYGQRPDTSLPLGASKLEWCLDFVQKVAPYAAAVKPNRNYIKDLSRKETKELVSCIHELGMLAIDDSKLADIGETNESGFYHASQEGFDAVTYAPFPGNTREAVVQAHGKGLGLIALVLMSNPEFEVIKNSTIRGMKGYEYFALQVAEYGADAIVIGAPSEKNHLKDEEVRRVKEIVGERLVLMPGVGAQGGEAQYILNVFGDNVIANVGRAILYAHDPATEAAKYQSMLNDLRKRA
ncbi:orotidine 5'-phosphate decarboxylase [Candidatus Woesearchaeota archaeon]|nr:orotidine 5'-phosphate decarboxylase [Candidatus Woesearchaeota archaeon]